MPRAFNGEIPSFTWYKLFVFVFEDMRFDTVADFVSMRRVLSFWFDVSSWGSRAGCFELGALIAERDFMYVHVRAFNSPSGRIEISCGGRIF